MSSVCSKYCFMDWFEDAKPEERRLCKVYMDDLGPFENTSDKDLIQFLGYEPSVHTSKLVSGELGTESAIREDVFFFRGQPEVLEQMSKVETVEFALVKIRSWCKQFEKYEIGWHPLYVRFANLLELHGEDYFINKIKAYVEDKQNGK